MLEAFPIVEMKNGVKESSPKRRAKKEQTKRFLEHAEGNLLTQVIRESNAEGAPLVC